MFGVLMKVRLSHTGGVISPVENEFMSCQSDSNSSKSPSERLLKSLHASHSFRTYSAQLLVRYKILPCLCLS